MNLRHLASFALAYSALAANAAPTVVTPGNLQGWFLGNGFGGAQPPAAITGAQPFEGDGSIAFSISASSQQPLAAYLFAAPVRFGDLLTSGASLGYSYLLPVGTAPNAGPTIRLLLSGLTNTTQVGRSDGSIGWYLNGAADGTWHTESFDMVNGDFFFRVGGKGQVSKDSCANTTYAGSFDDRRQTLSDWATECDGAGTNVNLRNANVIGMQVDWGSFVPAGPVVTYADRIKFNIGSNTGDFNFERAQVPEPASLALVGLSLALLASTRRRRA